MRTTRCEERALAGRLELVDVHCVGMPGSTCDEADQLVVALNPDTNMPIGFVARGLQRPLQKVVCVLESALKNTRVVQSVSSTL